MASAGSIAKTPQATEPLGKFYRKWNNHYIAVKRALYVNRIKIIMNVPSQLIEGEDTASRDVRIVEMLIGR
jgi:hypothetical protein